MQASYFTGSQIFSHYAVTSNCKRTERTWLIKWMTVHDTVQSVYHLDCQSARGINYKWLAIAEMREQSKCCGNIVVALIYLLINHH